MADGTCQGCGAERPSSQRKWCSERCRKAQYSTPCVDCGAPVNGSDGRNAHQRCGACARGLNADRVRELARERQGPKRQRVLAMLAQGKTDQQIADALGTTKGTAASFIHRLRAYGYDVRRPPGRGRPRRFINA